MITADRKTDNTESQVYFAHTMEVMDLHSVGLWNDNLIEIQAEVVRIKVIDNTSSTYK
jgi:hypothetical protein